VSSSRIILLAHNGGYAFGMNAGISAAIDFGYNAAIMINADSRPTRSVLQALRSTLDMFDIAGIRQSASPELEVEYPTAGIRRGLVFQEFGCSGCQTGVHSVDLVSGALVGIRVNVWRDLSGLNERYFHYKEEVDFCLRARLMGCSIGWICSDTAFHARGGSLPSDSALATYYRARNEILYFYWNSVGPAGIVNPRLWATEIRHLKRAMRANRTRAWVRGIQDGFARQCGRVEMTNEGGSSETA
jgi:GT2 family glycosyltransferase